MGRGVRFSISDRIGYKILEQLPYRSGARIYRRQRRCNLDLGAGFLDEFGNFQFLQLLGDLRDRPWTDSCTYAKGWGNLQKS